MSGYGTTLPFKPGRMNGRLPSLSARQASGCFVCFREVDHSMPLADMGAKLPSPREAKLPLRIQNALWLIGRCMSITGPEPDPALSLLVAEVPKTGRPRET